MSDIFSGFGNKYSYIGTSDRSMFDSEDDLILKNEPLKKDLTAAEAEKFVKDNPGAEIIIREENGTYSVYQLEVSEKGKEILNSDFTDGTINITKDVLNIAGGKKAYVSTSTNYLRTFDIPSIEIDNLEQSLVTADLNLNIQDLDGIDSNSKKDIKGNLNGGILIDQDLIKYSLAKASKKTGVDFALDASPRNNLYKISASYGVGLGNITIQPQDNGTLKVEIGGLAGGVATVADFTSGIKDNVDKMLAELCKDIGFKVSSSSITDYTLVPDLKSNVLLSEIPLGVKDASIKIEEIKVKPEDLKIKVDQNGNLKIDIFNSEVIASSDGNAAPMKSADKEGPDEINVALSAQMGNDFNSEIKSKTNIKVNVLKTESEDFKKQVQKYSGQEMDVNGKFELKDIEVNLKLDKSGNVTEEQGNSGSVNVEKLNITADKTTVSIDSAAGNLKSSQKGSLIKLSSEDAALKGKIDSSLVKLDITDMKLGGDFLFDLKDPDKISFNADDKTGIGFTGKIKAANGNVKINNLALKGSEVGLDLGKNTLDITPNSETSIVSLKSLYFPGGDALYGINMKGSLKADFKNNSFSLKAKDLKLSANLGQLSLTYLNGSGDINYDPVNGLKVSNANILASGKIGNFEIKKLKGAGNVDLTPDGKISFSNTKNLELETNIGLKVKGNLQISQRESTYFIETTGNKPVNIDYKGQNGIIDLSGVEFRGKASYNQLTSELNFSGYEEQPLEISKGKINNEIFDNVSLNNGTISVATNNGSFDIQPLPGKSFVFKGKTEGLNITDLECNGKISVDPRNQTLSLDKEAKVSLPEYGLNSLSTNGPLSLKIQNDQLILESKGTAVNAKFGNISLENIVLDGQLVYNLKTNTISFKGTDGKEFKIDGKINSKPVQVASTGTFQIQDLGERLSFSGENIKINGLLDGFSLESPEGASGKLLISKDFTTIDLQELKFNINLEGIELNNDKGLFKVSENGYEINLSGNLELKKEKLTNLFEKFSKNESFSGKIKSSVDSVFKSLDKNLSGFNDTKISYEDLIINLDQNGSLKDFHVKSRASISDTQLKVNLDEKEKNVSVGNVDLITNADADQNNFSIKNGQVEFELGDELRSYIADLAKSEMESAGFKDIELEIMKNGDVSVKNATFIKKKNLFSNEKVKGIQTKFKINTKIENNQLVVSLDKFTLKNILADAVNKTIDGKKIVSNQVDKALQAEDIDFERNKKTDEFSIDVNSLLKSKLGKGFNLNNISLSDEGKVMINYDYSPSSLQ